MEGSPMEIVPLGPGFAAELRGVTLAGIAADDAAYKETRAALEEHSVLVFRGQDVTDEAQLTFSRRFGPLEVTKVGSQGTGTEADASTRTRLTPLLRQFLPEWPDGNTCAGIRSTYSCWIGGSQLQGIVEPNG